MNYGYTTLGHRFTRKPWDADRRVGQRQESTPHQPPVLSPRSLVHGGVRAPNFGPTVRRQPAWASRRRRQPPLGSVDICVIPSVARNLRTLHKGYHLDSSLRCATFRITMALRRPHKGMKMAWPTPSSLPRRACPVPDTGRESRVAELRVRYRAGSKPPAGDGFPPPTARGQALRGNDGRERGNDGCGCLLSIFIAMTFDWEPLECQHNLASGPRFSLLCSLATPTGFEPALSALTGQCVRPLHHGAAMELAGRAPAQAC